MQGGLRVKRLIDVGHDHALNLSLVIPPPKQRMAKNETQLPQTNFWVTSESLLGCLLTSRGITVAATITDPKV